jgi:hypothetical protein
LQSIGIAIAEGARFAAQHVCEQGLQLCKPLIVWRARQDEIGHWIELVLLA